MRLSWNEVRARAAKFAREHADDKDERSQSQRFWIDFFDIFGLDSRRVTTFEKRVQQLDATKRGFIDLYWPGTLIIEHKSAGRDLLSATKQALDYFDWLSEKERPRYVLVCDFQRFQLTDLADGREWKFHLSDLPRHVEAFAFILGAQPRFFRNQSKASIAASELMGKLHEALAESGYTGQDLERLLVRLLFCLFADDTGIFEPKDLLINLIEQHTSADGRDLGRVLNDLFDVLNTPEEQRQSTLDPELTAFPYINGGLFEGRIRTPSFNNAMRDMLLDACAFDWGEVSPAIFGSLFQSVMDAKARRAKGAHYTTEQSILKVIEPLFLDDLRAELDRVLARKDGGRQVALKAYHDKLASLTFFDPACGCGNFLVIAYRELRELERKLLKETLAGTLISGSGVSAAAFSRVNVDQFFGIEYEEFPARIAETAMWMADHLANLLLSADLGELFARIPLTKSAKIVQGDALDTDWAEVLSPERCSYVLGNPPFIGAKFQSEYQRAQVRRVAGLGGSGGTLDYVAAWFIRAAAFVQRGGGKGRIGFVSTNSITQGEQVAQLWPILFGRHAMEIAFAHRTFAWSSEARGMAHVHVVIIGLAARGHEPADKRLFAYADLKGEPSESRHRAISPYLFDAGGLANPHVVVAEAGRPINGARQLVCGSKPIDGGHLIFSSGERATLVSAEPQAASFLRPFVGAEEFINGGQRYILALQNAAPQELRAMPKVRERLERVREFRAASPSKPTKALAATPMLYHLNVLPERPFLAIPQVSSERRQYIPIGWIEPPTIPSDKLRILADASLWEFGVLTSAMHMAWTSFIGGRLKSDFQYGIGINYNNFPWPKADEVQMRRVEGLAQTVLDERAKHTLASLADLYDPDTMPPALRAAHAKLDAAVDRLYRPTTFPSDRARAEHLLGLYEASLGALPLNALKTKTRRKRATETV
ncbi:class I SAM-dependent DNA methyltransferase [Sandaracinobacter neustonicus]|uniref:site-specific DNA-methyltransferase (adenine-specific) n=1 Tax=Sandaracinobacter neustonicus TaxID=1715348 RepID=A0A501XPU6_9SPHN|nr:DNA methyltransferase [Sandaracinobacter neustonicus]TPE62313.1 class I SAM-dependent DNA methyltransferase [Sandaracinobacter neustonicus]